MPDRTQQQHSRLVASALAALFLLPLLSAAQSSIARPGLRELAPSAADGVLSFSGPTVASAGQTNGRARAGCPFPALYAVFTLPSICTDRAFEQARAKFTAALTALAGPGSIVRPRYIEDERRFGARSVHTVIVYTAPGGWGQATWLRLQLEGNASSAFDIATFGAVYVRAVSAPYMALLSSVTYAPATLPAYSMASAMFSLAWPKDRAPASIGSAEVAAFTAAVKARLPGAVMHVTRHTSESTCTSRCSRGKQGRRRAVLAAAVAPSHYSASCPGRVVFNVVVASPNRAQLAQLVRLVETQPGAIWPQGKFGKLEAEGLSGIRLVPTKGYTEPPRCQPAPPPPSPMPPQRSPAPPPPKPQQPKPLVTQAQALSSSSGVVTGAPRPGLTCKQYTFTLTPPRPAAVVTSPPVGAPTFTFSSLAAGTTFQASVTCITPTGVRVQSSNTLPLTTPSASSFAILTANPASPTTATVLLGPLSAGRPRLYSVRACLEGAPTNCRSVQCGSASCGPIAGLAPGKRYSVTANATLTGGTVLRASNTLPLAMPPAAAPVLLSASPAGLTKGTAVAVQPSTGACPAYFWVFAPLAGGAQVNATTTTLTITTATGALVPGGIYETKVACMRSGRSAAARSLRQVTLGPFSNTLRFVMPAPGAPFVDAEATGAFAATVVVQPPPGFTSRFELTVCLLGAPASSCGKVPCTTPQACNLTGLDPGTLFSVTVVAFNAASAPSAVSNTASFLTCPADRSIRCGSTCIAADTCCKSEPAVGARCAAPLTCPSDGSACGCPSGQVKCGSSRCINPATQCCKTDASVGLKCTFPAVCNADGSACGCPSGQVKCGTWCIDPATQCCKTDASVGLKCDAPLSCLEDGISCRCPAGQNKCGSLCISPDQCCASKPSASKTCLPGTVCTGDGGSCRSLPSCPSGQVKCGTLCIDPATQCCKTDANVGLKCYAPLSCLEDGISCRCPPGKNKCGKLCISPDQCCASTPNASKICLPGTFCTVDGGSCRSSPTCPGGLVDCGGVCISSDNCCVSNSSVGAQCTAPFICRSDGSPCDCPAGQTKCGSLCINPATECCATFTGVGLQCSSPLTCPRDGGSCACPDGKVACGNQCIDPANQCCKTNTSIGLQCISPFSCPSDGGSCGCPSGQIDCDNICIDAGTCCASDPSVGAQCTAPRICLCDGGTCGCPWDKVDCDGKCISPSTCCKSDPSVGAKCPDFWFCESDGGSCGP